MMRAFFIALMLSSLLLACGGKNRLSSVKNPYSEQSASFLSDGMIALDHELWGAAEKAFLHALLAAQLSDDTVRVRVAWYQLGVARASTGERANAALAFKRAMLLSKRHQDAQMQLRAELALALLNLRYGERGEPVPLLKSGMPADIYLQQARLAQLLGEVDLAEQAYHAAIKQRAHNRRTLRLQATAYMGLALLYRQKGDEDLAAIEVRRSLKICRQVGAPRLTAHALLLSANFEVSTMAKKDRYERALVIYTALKDEKGQYDTLSGLISMAKSAHDSLSLGQLKQRLQQLSTVNP